MRVLRGLRRLDCPSALTWQTWAIAYAPSVSTAVLHDRNLYGGSLLAWLTVALIGAAGAGLVLLLAHLILRSMHPVAVLLGTFFLAGSVRGLGVGWSADVLGLVPDPQFGVRALSGGILGIFWLSVATFIVDGFRRHRAQRLTLEQLEQNAESDNQRAAFELQQLQARVNADVLANIAAVSRSLSSAAIARSPSTLRELAGQLHDLSADVVRPLSHDAVRTMPQAPAEERRKPGGGLWTLVRDAVTVDPFRPGWTLALLLPSILMTAIRGYGFVLGLLGAVWIAGMAALVLTIARTFLTQRLRRLPLPTRGLIVIIVWFLAAAASALPVALASWWGLGPTDAWQVFGIPLFAYVPVMSAGLAAAGAITNLWAIDEDERETRIAALRWQTQRMHQQLHAERTRLGRYLHGSVQSRLTATALKIEYALRDEALLDTSALISEVQADLRVLSTNITQFDEAPVIDVEARATLEGIAAVWSRTAHITLEIDSTADVLLREDAGAAESTVEIVREGISNAVRHGCATQISVEITADADIVIEIRDNGRFDPNAVRGMGSVQLDEMCSHWQRQPLPRGGTSLQCELPTSRRSADRRS